MSIGHSQGSPDAAPTPQVAAPPGEGVAKRLIRRAVPRRYRQQLLGPLAGLWYRGDEVECTCCQRSFRSFRLHELTCPRCGAIDRTRLLCLYFERHPQLLRPGTRLLFFAPEYGLKRWFSRWPGLKYVTADLDSPLADDHVDIRSLPYADGSFDATLCTHVLEHVDDDAAALRELFRILRPGGWAIVMVPFSNTYPLSGAERAVYRSQRRETTLEDPAVVDAAERTRLYGQHDHVRLYGADFTERLERAGFVVEEVHFVGELPSDIVLRARLTADDDIFFCTKPAGAPAGDQPKARRSSPSS